MRQAHALHAEDAATGAAAAAAESAATGAAGKRQVHSLTPPYIAGGESAGLRDVAQQIARALGAARCAVYLLLAERDELVRIAEWSAQPTSSPERPVTPGVRLRDVPVLSDAVCQRRVVRVSGDEDVLPPGTRRWLANEGAATAIVVPLELMGTVTGCLLLFDCADRQWPRGDELALLTALSAPVAAALKNARRLRAQKERNRHLDSLLESIRAMTSSATLADVLDVVAAQAAAALGVPTSVIFEYVPETDALVLRADTDRALGSDRATELGDSYDLNDYPFDRRLLETGEIVQQCLSDDLVDEITRQTMVENGERSCLSVALSFKGQAVGLLEIIETRWERVFSQAERDMACAIGEQAAAAIVNARLYRYQELHAQRLSSLLEVGRTISSNAALPELLEQVARVSAEALGARVCVMLEYSSGISGSSGDQLIFRAGHDRGGAADQAYWAGFTYALDEFPGDRAILEGRHAVVERVSDPRIDAVNRASMEEWGERTYLNVPLAYGGRILGLLQFIETDRERDFLREELEFAEGIGEQVAVAVHNEQRYRELREATSALEQQLQVRHDLLELSEVLLTLRDREAVFQHIAGVLRMLVQYESLEISLIDRAAGDLVEVFQGEGSVNMTLGLRLPLHLGVCGRIIAKGQPEMVDDMLHDPSAVQVPGTDEEEQASIIVPLQVAGEIIGVLSMSRFDGRTFAEREFQLVQLVTNLTAIAIQNARLYDELQDKAIRDGLTGLYNHRHFYERLTQEVARSQRYGTPLSLLMIDLDDFKRFNDCHGHLVGDEALAVFARCLLDEVRHDVDIVARYGGEEFAVLLPNTACRDDGVAVPSGAVSQRKRGAARASRLGRGAGVRGARANANGVAETGVIENAPGCAAATVAERIRARISREMMGTVADATDGRLTASIGVATLPEMAHDEHQLIKRADKALYTAKRLGKDRVEVYEA